MSELASELELAAAQAQGNSRAEQYKLQEQQREKRMGILEGDLKGLVTGVQLQHVEERMGELEEWAGKQLQQVKGGLEAEIDALRCRQRRETGVQLQLMEEQMEKRMGILEACLEGRMSGVSELAAAQDRRIRATAVQVEKRVEKHMEDHMAELASLLALTELKEDVERVWDIQSGALDELNEDVQRLYIQSFGALVEERKSPDGGWYTKQEFNRFFSDDGLTWSECSGAKRGRPVR